MDEDTAAPSDRIHGRATPSSIAAEITNNSKLGIPAVCRLLSLKMLPSNFVDWVVVVDCV